MNTTQRVAEVLKLMTEHPCRFTDVARDLQLTKSTAHRLLKSMEQGELIKKNPLTGYYHLGPLIAQLAASTINEHQFLIACSIEEMRRLRDVSHETVNIQISMGTERMCLEEIQSPESLKFVSGKGAIYPIFVGSAGKMLMSMMDNSQIQVLMTQFYYDQTAPNPITTPDEMWKEIEIARDVGYSTSFGERISGSSSVAVPIHNYVCPVILNILGPVTRFDQSKISNIIGEMKNSVSKISEYLSQ